MTELELEAVRAAKKHFMRDNGEGDGWDFEVGMQLLSALTSTGRGRGKRLQDLIDAKKDAPNAEVRGCAHHETLNGENNVPTL